MRHLIWLAILLFAGMLRLAAAAADEASAVCAITPENAHLRLEKAVGDADQALREWRRLCPNEDMAMFYSDEIQKAKSGRSQPSSPSAAVAPGQQQSKPIGSFAYSGREDYDDRSGFEEWDDTLTIREDGTAELSEKYHMVLYRKWYVGGCEEYIQSGNALAVQDYRVTVEGSTVTFTREGSTEVKRMDPACWNLSREDFFVETWSLQWQDGRLTNKSGKEYRRLP